LCGIQGNPEGLVQKSAPSALERRAENQEKNHHGSSVREPRNNNNNKKKKLPSQKEKKRKDSYPRKQPVDLVQIVQFFEALTKDFHLGFLKRHDVGLPTNSIMSSDFTSSQLGYEIKPKNIIPATGS
jgi:hypothetical protein